MPAHKRFSRLSLIAIVIIGSVLFYSFAEWRTGSGSQTVITSSGKTLSAIYGIQSGEKLGFAILIDFPGSDINATSNSDWEGSASHGEGVKVSFEASMMEIRIDGKKFDFDDGHVFVVKGTEPVMIIQLEVTPKTSHFSRELERIAALPEVDRAVKTLSK